MSILEQQTARKAGDIFAKREQRWKLNLFFALVRMQNWTRRIAAPIDWEALPGAASV